MISDISLIIAVIVILLRSFPLLKRYVRWLEFSKAINRIPGPLNLPIVGTAWQYMGLPRDQFFNKIRECNRKYPKIYRLWIGTKAVVHVTDAEAAAKIKGVTKHTEKSYVYDFLRPWLGDGLILSWGEKWHKHRKIITPSFHFSILEGFCEVFAEQAEILMRILQQRSATGNVINICPLVSLTALDIICETAMGTKIHAQSDSNNEYVNALSRITEKTYKRMLSPWLFSDFIFFKTSHGREFEKSLNTTQSFTMSVIQDRMKARKLSQAGEKDLNSNDDDTGEKKRRVFLDVLLDACEDGNNLTMAEMIEEVNTFMFAGHDTTTSGISWALFCIGLYEDVQRMCFDEINSVYANCVGSPTMKDLNEMKYLERVIKEAMRLYPSVPIIGNKTSEPVELAGYSIPKDCSIHLHIHHINRDPDNFANPDVFDPDRFLPINSIARHPFAYIPFSAGPRNCIGQKFAMLEEKAVISAVIRNFRITSMQKHEDVKLITELILSSGNGIQMLIEKRH